MIKHPALAAVVIAGLFGAAGPAAAERLVVSLSNHRVLVTSNFTGADVVLFGSIEQDRAPIARRSGYDFVVTVSGPRQPVLARRKERVLGIWVNAQSRAFNAAPAYLAVLASRAFDQIANAETLVRQQIGIDNYPLTRRADETAAIARDDPFRAAFVRLKKEHGLYREDAKGVTFLTPTLFRASIPLPAEAPIGNYAVDIKLFADGALIARSSSAMEVVKVGFEQYVANAARNHGILYGLATTAMALLTGWVGAFVFRRD